MTTKIQYWLVTTKNRYCSGYETFVIDEHPAEYMTKQIKEALILAVPITKKQFEAYQNAYCGA